MITSILVRIQVITRRITRNIDDMDTLNLSDKVRYGSVLLKNHNVMSKLHLAVIFGRPNECDGRIPLSASSSVNLNKKKIKEIYQTNKSNKNNVV